MGWNDHNNVFQTSCQWRGSTHLVIKQFPATRREKRPKSPMPLSHICSPLGRGAANYSSSKDQNLDVKKVIAFKKGGHFIIGGSWDLAKLDKLQPGAQPQPWSQTLLWWSLNMAAEKIHGGVLNNPCLKGVL